MAFLRKKYPIISQIGNWALLRKKVADSIYL